MTLYSMSSHHNIKELKPQTGKNARYKQGYINPVACKKLFPGQERIPIIYRSSYELKFIKWCEQTDRVKHWGSECLKIPYTNILDKKQHIYYPDYVIEFQDGSIWVVEIKPMNQTKKPINENCWASKEWVKNMCKWSAAEKFCKDRGLQFKVFTEKTIDLL